MMSMWSMKRVLLLVISWLDNREHLHGILWDCVGLAASGVGFLNVMNGMEADLSVGLLRLLKQVDSVVLSI